MSKTSFKGLGEDGAEEEENSVEEAESYGIEIVPDAVGASEGTRRQTLAQYNKTGSHHSEPSLFAIMQQNDQNYGQSSICFIL
ncbi:hypothetical protein O181_086980 [Austropuccinia psidii MF-1]|uniref:Uncharacterized protein n=1 Tax=Austropuccinia psidii MF-1 TaxID=1389203 RepID=A0A9Q3P103_9BASI|nr:hypothetical protein [Austropuccinia psidii MF-1]